MSIPPSADAAGAAARRALVLVHGGGFKPHQDALRALWRDALAAGLDRDFAAAGGRELLDGVDLDLVYYGDLVNGLLAAAATTPEPELDLADRHHDLSRLTGLGGRKQFRRAQYEALPGKSALREFVADVAAPVLTAMRLADPVLARRLPALAAYLSGSPEFREACETRLLLRLAPRLERRQPVLLLSHGMGSVVSYDALWRLSHDADWSRAGARLDTWITCGSPLASEYVKQRLRGAGQPPDRRYPERLTTWYNVAAEDDFYCHDKTVADDFAALLESQRISRVKDYHIYNVAIRYGRSNPHNAVGYLVHPRLTRLLADWLGVAEKPSKSK